LPGISPKNSNDQIFHGVRKTNKDINNTTKTGNSDTLL